jgi:hypothetical protein
MTPERVFRSVALWLPFGFVALCLLVQTAALPFLPDLVVSKWSFDGQPTQWRPAWEALVVTGIIGVGTIAVCSVAGARIAKNHAPQVFAALTWLVLMLSLPFLTVIVVAQVWLDDLHVAQAFLASAVAAVVTAFSATVHVPSAPSPLHERDPEQWSRATRAERVTRQPTFEVGMSALVGSMSAIAAVFGTVWWVLGATILISALSSAQRVSIARIDAGGVVARSLLGFPRARIALADIESMELARIDPVADLGRIGWNTRTGSAQQGVAMRTGEGLRIRRRSGVDFLLATDDAAGAEQMLGAQRAAERRA